jgi:hypothetical protein
MRIGLADEPVLGLARREAPGPFGPRKPVIVPGASENNRSSTAVTEPNRFVTPSTDTTAPCVSWTSPAMVAERRRGRAEARPRGLRYSNFASTCFTMV